MKEYKTSPVITSGAEKWSMTSRYGRRYDIYISIPKQPAPESGYPIIYVLDGNAFFHTFHETVKVQSARSEKTKVIPAVIVGIGYPVDAAFASEFRVYDFTPPTSVENLPPKPDGSAWSENGGAEEFFHFITQELQPCIEQHVSIDRQKQTLFGHSLGGLFALYVLFSGTSAFQTFMITSPSIWWGNRVILELVKNWAANTDISEKRVFLAVGELEKDHMVNDARDLAIRLEELRSKGLTTVFYELTDENHVSVVPTVISRAIRFLHMHSG